MARVTGANPRLLLARAVAAGVLARYGASVRAVGVHGSLAHGDDDEHSDVDLVVVTVEPGQGPAPVSRRVDGIVLDLGVIGAQEYLAEARTLGVDWPLAADQYLTTLALHDEVGWHRRLRSTHEQRLATAHDAEFYELARPALVAAIADGSKAARAERRQPTRGSALPLDQARLSTALPQGLLTRTHFRGMVDALVRTGLQRSSLADVLQRQDELAEALARSGRPIDVPLSGLLADDPARAVRRPPGEP